jgi:hypothetical protein
MTAGWSALQKMTTDLYFDAPFDLARPVLYLAYALPSDGNEYAYAHAAEGLPVPPHHLTAGIAEGLVGWAQELCRTRPVGAPQELPRPSILPSGIVFLLPIEAGVGCKPVLALAVDDTGRHAVSFSRHPRGMPDTEEFVPTYFIALRRLLAAHQRPIIPVGQVT